ncbi:MAG: molybdate ABC transporter substrate-binding protein [Alphaproteobacteria bacterium]|nr:molybdate ABC transporter substrate-binding protein [Alphaproteobacteria bacterium]
MARSSGGRLGVRSILHNRRAAAIGWLLPIILLAAVPAHADYPVAPDVVVFCEPTLSYAITDVAALWRSETGIHVRVFASPTAVLLEQIAHHARADVLIGEGEANAGTAAKRGLISPGTLERVWRNQLVVAALAGSAGAAGTGSPAAGSLAAAAGKQPIAIVDPWAATAGAASQKALQSLGLWQAVSAKSIGVVGTADAVYLLAQGKVPLAIVYATDVAADPALMIAERLPAASYPPVVYWLAQTQHSLSPNTGKFIAFLQGALAHQRLRADGLEVLS